MKNRLSVCLISNDFYPNIIGGVGIYTEKLASGLARKGHKVYVIASANQFPNNFHRNINFYITKERNLFKFWRFCRKIFNSQNFNDLDIIHGSDIFHLPVCFKKTSAKIITTTHNSYLQRFSNYKASRKIYYPLLIFFEQLVLSKSDGIITVSDFSKSYLEKYFIDKQKIQLIPNGVDINNYKPSIKGNYVKKLLLLKNDDKIILFVGRLVENKRPLFLVNLAKKFFPKNWHLLIIGEGPLEEKIRLEINSAKNIHLIGKVDNRQMPDIYNSCNVFALPSKSEGLSLTLLEALSSGLPIVITPQTQFKNIVENNLNGFCIETDNEENWFRAINNCLNNEKNFSIRSREKILEYQLTEENFIDKHERFYYEIIR